MRKRFLVVGPILIMGAWTWRSNFTDFCQRSAVAHLQAGERFYHSGDLESAVSHMEAAVREDPKLFEARDALGTLYQLTDRPQQELQAYLDGVRLFPDDPRLHYILGMCYYGRRKFADCATEMQTCLKLGPYNPQYFHLLGMSYERCGRIADAHALWAQGARDHDSDPIINRGLQRTKRMLASSQPRAIPASVSQQSSPKPEGQPITARTL